jgi:hypothetical protein
MISSNQYCKFNNSRPVSLTSDKIHIMPSPQDTSVMPSPQDIDLALYWTIAPGRPSKLIHVRPNGNLIGSPSSLKEQTNMRSTAQNFEYRVAEL